VKCDRCDNEATVHEVMISGGKSMERHLCERCATSAGMQVQSPLPVTQILAQLMKGAAAAAAAGAGGGAGKEKPAGGGAPGAGGTLACPNCGLAFAQFRQAGMLGCPQCYATFEGQLGPLLSRAHEGGTHHIGKMPRGVALARTATQAQGVTGGAGVAGGAGGAGGGACTPAEPALDAERQKRLALLRTQLAEAIAAEHYERAANLRDELHKIESAPKPVPAPASMPSTAPTKATRATRKVRTDPDGGAGKGTGDGGGGGAA